MSDYLLTLVDSLATRNGGLVVGPCPECCGGPVTCGTLCCTHSTNVIPSAFRCGWPLVQPQNQWRLYMTGTITVTIEGAYTSSAVLEPPPPFSFNRTVVLDMTREVFVTPPQVCVVLSNTVQSTAVPVPGYFTPTQVTATAGWVAPVSTPVPAFVAEDPARYYTRLDGATGTAAMTAGLAINITPQWPIGQGGSATTAGIQLRVAGSNVAGGSHPSGPVNPPHWRMKRWLPINPDTYGPGAGLPFTGSDSWQVGTLEPRWRPVGCVYGVAGGGWGGRADYSAPFVSGSGGTGYRRLSLDAIDLEFGVDICCGGDSLPDGSPDLGAAHDAMMRGAYGRPCQGCG